MSAKNDAIQKKLFSKSRLIINGSITKIVNTEIGFLGNFQKKYRSPFLDFYFKAVAVACDHVFFTYMLPLLFWFGFASFARGMTLMVLLIVAATGWLKDYVSTDRPKSPPLERLSFNKGHAIEFGFPSTHSAYVVGSAVYLTTLIYRYDLLTQYSITVSHAISYSSIWFFALSVLVGRIYCGMHSVIDVVGGVIFGSALSYPLAFWFYEIDSFFFLDTITGPLSFAGFTFAMLYYHPKFVGRCLCYQDTFSAISVINGVAFGSYLFLRFHPISEPNGTGIYFDFEAFGPAKTVVRTVLGVILIAVWKTASDKVILSALGPKSVVGRSEDIKPEIESQMFGNRQIIYSNKNLTRIPVYFGIGFFVVFPYPWILYYLGL